MTIADLQNEINSINDLRFQELVIDILNRSPVSFWEIPASTTGKYHPEYTLGRGGLVRHVKAATQILNYILDLEYCKSLIPAVERDCMRVAILIHDCEKCKHKHEHSRFEHPLIIANRVRNYKGMYENITDDELELIAQLCESHMGEWHTSKHSPITLPKPHTYEQFIVHLADFLASRKNITISINKGNK